MFCCFGSRAKRRGRSLQELAKYDPIPLGEAVHISADRLAYKYIIHVVGINKEEAEKIMVAAMEAMDSDIEARIMRFKR